jgi:branched-chain amino acid transport system permease protein
MIVQALLSGIALGSLYALIALGYYVTNTTTRTMNFAQGDFLMVGAVVTLTLWTVVHVPFWLSFLAALALLALFGVILERYVVQPVKHGTSLAWIMSTVGVSLILRNAVQVFWGTSSYPFPAPFGNNVIHIFGAGVLPQEIVVGVASLGLTAALLLFLRFTLYGKALTAVAYDAETVALMGVNVRRMAVFVYVVSSLLAGIAGVLIAPIMFVSAYMGALLGLKAFTAGIVGGFDNPVGIFIAGLLIGVVELLVASVNATFRDPIVFVLIIVFLFFRPQGLFARRDTVNA